MALFTGTQEAYYTGSNLGNYQFISFADLKNNFLVSYVGEDKITSKVRKTDVIFHALRAVQELSYDTLKSFKSIELEVPNSLKLMKDLRIIGAIIIICLRL